MCTRKFFGRASLVLAAVWAGGVLATADTVTLKPAVVCQHSGDTLVVRVDRSSAAAPVVGGDFFLQFDPSIVTFVSAAPGDSPFQQIVPPNVNPVTGTLDYAVRLPFGNPGTTADVVMATFTFTVRSGLADDCDIPNV